MQSQRMLPVVVFMRMQRCPIANFGVVEMDMKRGSWGRGVRVFLYLVEEERRVERVVKDWPVGGTN